MSTQQIPLTYEQMMALFLETREQMKKTDEQMKANAEQMKANAEQMKVNAEQMKASAAKTDLQMQKTDKQIEATNKAVDATNKTVEATNKTVASLSDKVGDMVEKLLGEGNLIDQFRELGHEVKTHSQKKKFGKRGTAESGEIDLFLEDGDVAILVEAKTTLKMDDVHDHIERIEKYRRFVDDGGKTDKRFVGAVAGTVIAENVINFAHENGLYVIIQSARAVEIITQPKGFVARKW